MDNRLKNSMQTDIFGNIHFTNNAKHRMGNVTSPKDEHKIYTAFPNKPFTPNNLHTER